MKRLLMSMACSMLMMVCLSNFASAASVPTFHIKPYAAPHVLNAHSVGGCRENTGGPSRLFEMGVCISDRNTSSTVYPDVYVNQQPQGPFSCTLYIELWDGNYKISQDAGHSCTIGHYTSTLLTTVSGGCLPLHTSAWISYFGTFYRIGDSPTYTYCG